MMKWLFFVNTYDFRSSVAISIEITAKYEFYLVLLHKIKKVIFGIDYPEPSLHHF